MISLTTPYRTVVGVLVVWVTELLLSMSKLRTPSVLRIHKKTEKKDKKTKTNKEYT